MKKNKIKSKENKRNNTNSISSNNNSIINTSKCNNIGRIFRRWNNSKSKRSSKQNE